MTGQRSARTVTPGIRGWLVRWDEAVAGAALAAVFAAVVWGVFARYVAPRPAVWTGEVAAIGFAWVVFVGAAAAARRRLHVGVDLFTARLPGRMRALLERIVNLGLAVLLGYMAWLSWQIGLEAMDRPTPVLRLPYSVMYLAPVVGLSAMAAGSLLDAVRGARP